MDWDKLLVIGLFVLIVWAIAKGGTGYKGARTWSGDTPDEEGRRNTRTDSNYQGHDRWTDNRSDRGW